jgi:hypothetical protein
MPATKTPDWLPCEIRLEPRPASPAQAEAWRCLWQRLLAEDAATTRPQEDEREDRV